MQTQTQTQTGIGTLGYIWRRRWLREPGMKMKMKMKIEMEMKHQILQGSV